MWITIAISYPIQGSPRSLNRIGIIHITVYDGTLIWDGESIIHLITQHKSQVISSSKLPEKEFTVGMGYSPGAFFLSLLVFYLSR
jgi:hypothetical protein